MTPPQDDGPGPVPRLRSVERTEPPEGTPGPGKRALRRRRLAALAAVQDVPRPKADAALPAEADPAPVRKRRPRRPPPAPVEPPMQASLDPLPARPKPRHWGMLASFVLLVLLPFAASVWYLYARAADQYHSEVAFSIRSEEAGVSAAAGLLGALTHIGSGSASDTDILFEFIKSQKIVEEIDAELDLRSIYNRAEGDPVFTLGSDRSIEALRREWSRMVDVSFESTGGIIHIRANAFAPEDARAIATAILAHSGTLVNRLSDQAREDAVRFARSELADAEDNLRKVRQRLADFRHTNRLVDPAADAEGQMGLLNALQAQLAQALVDRDVMLSYADAADQRVIQVNRRIDAITERIEAERASLGIGGASGALPEVLGTYEELQVDMEFANKAYVESLAALAAARAEAQRQSHYLAPHIQPTLATTSLYPRRMLLAGLTGLFLLLGWGVMVLIYYNVRDSR